MLSQYRSDTLQRMGSHESNDSDNLDDREDEFSLSVALDAEEIDRYNQDQKYGDPGGIVHTRRPEIHRDGSSDDFQWHGHQPVHGIVPPHCETPCRVYEASRER